MKEIVNLEPQLLWKYFGIIASIPRPSKHEDRIIHYLVELALAEGLHVKRDYIGNLVIIKRATKGFENRKKVVLQAHVDMVCEKNSDVQHNFLEDKIKYYIDGEWVKAQGTTLGADDGIGVAAMLAILTDKTISHGPLECLFTVDEETGLTGAFEIRPKFISGNILLNLDSEDEGEIFIGCAGGVDTTASFRIETEPCDPDSISYNIIVSGLQGGHSGDDIEKNRGNSVKILTEIVSEAVSRFQGRVIRFERGNLRNAIPREASANVVIPPARKDEFREWFIKKQQSVIAAYRENEPFLKVELQTAEQPAFLLHEDLQQRLLGSLKACPHGVISWSREIKDLVETSTNLASVKFTDDNRITIATSQRSSVDTEKKAIASKVASVFLGYNAEIRQGNGYPGWKPDPGSEILHIAKDAYSQLFGNEPRVKAIHAGLECGLFLEKYPDLDMISFGPTIKGAHSPDERLNIPTVYKFWQLLTEILKNIPEK